MPHESLQGLELLRAKLDNSPLPTPLQIKEESRQARGLLLRAIFLYDAWHNFAACCLAKCVQDDTHALQDTSLLSEQGVWSDDKVVLRRKVMTNGIQGYE